MIGAARSWLLALVSVSLLCAVADALMPKGAVRRVGRLVCGLTLVASILTPLARLDLEGSQRWLEDWLAQTRLREEELDRAVGGQLKTLIERDCAAYIVDKAAQLGLDCTARVECERSEDGVYLPARTETSGLWTAGAQEKLIRVIETDLGVPRERQFYVEEEIP